MTLATFALLWLALGLTSTFIGAILTTRRRGAVAKGEQL